MRLPISKSQRFTIFARDGFTCHYCGRQSDVVTLQVDHVIPVCQGGTNDPENLITSCSDCNLGKGGKTITQTVPTEADRLRLSQERNEQLEAYKTALSSAAARMKLRQVVINYWCDATGRKDADSKTISTVFSYATEFGTDKVFDWIDRAAYKTGGRDDIQMGRYVSGCRRMEKEREGQPNEALHRNR